MSPEPLWQAVPWRRYVAAAAVAVLGVVAVAQDGWSKEQYTSENGLLQNRVHAMERDPWGGLLIGTEGGLVRFDGENFQQIGIPSPEGMLPSRVLEIVPITDGGYVVRDAGSRQFLYRNNELTAITGDAPARKPTARFSGKGISVETTVRAMDPDSTLAGKKEWPYSIRLTPLGGQAWCVRTDNELLVYHGDSLADRFEIPVGKWSHLFTMGGRLYTFDKDGHAWIVDVATRQCRQIPAEGFPAPEQKDGQLTWRIHCGDRPEQVSLVTSEGLYTVHPSNDGLMAVRVPLDLPTDCRIGSVLWLREGTVLAVGTDSKGLYLFRRNMMKSLLCDMGGDGVSNAYFAQAPLGSNGVVSSTRSFSREFTVQGCREAVHSFPGFDEAAIILDHEERYWYGRGDSLFIFDPVVHEERLVQAGIRPLCFLEEGDRLLIGTPDGIYGEAQGQLTLINPMNGKDLSMRPTSLCRTPDGRLWVATCSGVYRALENGGWEPVAGLSGVCARALALVDSGVFIGTYGSGAFMYRNGKLLALPKDSEGFLSHVHAFMADSAGYLWMSTNQGLFRVRSSDLHQWARDTTQSLYMAHYGKSAGMRNSEFNGGCSPAYVRTGDGWASFPTMDGLVWFRPEDVPDAYPEQPVLLREVRVDGNKLDASRGKLTLPWDNREVYVSISLAYWGTQENARLEYLLDGPGGGKWQLFHPGQRELRLAALESGQTTLRIRKVGSAFRNGDGGLKLVFVVPVPYYRTYWFIGLCVVGTSLLLWLVLRLNAARLRRRNLQLEKMVRQRTGELVNANAVLRRSLEMKEMLVSIISHDIVTPLRFIARVSNGAMGGMSRQDPGRLKDTMQDIARSSDKLHANAQGLLQWIKRQDGRIELRMRNVALHPFIDEVIAMERERANDKGLKLLNETNFDDVVQTDRDVLSIVLHNLIANAVTHTRRGSVTVGGSMDGSGCAITVTDTGDGMPDAALAHALRLQGQGALGAMNGEGERDVQGLGLLIVADLLQLLGGSFEVQSGKDKGTCVTIRLPLQKAMHSFPQATPGSAIASTTSM
ncbi:MAG: hypothetical protein JST45_12475 [Bacteroidetes bacterium]|nr:hypothetical protein [Bacteroidota bacterium]